MLVAGRFDEERLLHMRIRKLNLRSSFFSLLSYAGYSTSVPDEPVVMGLEDLRDAMLAALGDTGSVRHPLLARQLRFARDAESLWYARSDLMGVLSSLYGELDNPRSNPGQTLSTAANGPEQ